MLPFLKKTKEASIATTPEIIKRASDDEGAEDYDHLESAAEDLIAAVHSKDAKGVAAAIRSAFDMLDEPEQDNEMGEE